MAWLLSKMAHGQFLAPVGAVLTGAARNSRAVFIVCIAQRQRRDWKLLSRQQQAGVHHFQAEVLGRPSACSCHHLEITGQSHDLPLI
jgi:hypothetical protein